MRCSSCLRSSSSFLSLSAWGVRPPKKKKQRQRPKEHKCHCRPSIAPHEKQRRYGTLELCFPVNMNVSITSFFTPGSLPLNLTLALASRSWAHVMVRTGLVGDWGRACRLDVKIKNSGRLKAVPLASTGPKPQNYTAVVFSTTIKSKQIRSDPIDNRIREAKRLVKGLQPSPANQKQSQ